MNIAEKLTTIAENEQKIYDKGYLEGDNDGYMTGKEQGRSEGYSQGESDFWDKVQNYGKRTHYDSAFYRWNSEYIRPKYKVEPTGRTFAMFSRNAALKKVEKEYFDLSGYKPNASASSTDSNYNLFYNCIDLEVVEDIGIQGGGYYYTYGYCENLHTVEVMRCVANGTYNAPFSKCSSLVNLIIDGEIGKNFSIYYSPLSTASIVSIIEHLSDTQGETLTLNKNAVNNMVFPYTSPYTNITYSSWDELIATKTNWTISTTTP